MEPREMIELIDQGIAPKQVAGKTAWTDLTPEQREQLFQEADQRKNGPEANPFLTLMYYLTREQLWDLLRVMTLIVLSKSSPYERKIYTLSEMRKKLDLLRDSFTSAAPQNAASLERYKYSEADYYALNGTVLFDGGKHDEAIRSLNAAQAKYEGLHAQERVALIQEKIAQITAVREKGRTLVPIQALEDERNTLKEELEQLNDRQTSLKQEIERLQNEIKSAALRFNQMETNLQDIKRRRDQAVKEETRLADSCAALQAQAQDLQRQSAEAEIGLQFLLALPRFAASPLWVEVARLALEQGEFDDLSLEAIRRLSVKYPDEGLPLLAEIVSRVEDLPASDACLSIQQGFRLVAQASSGSEASLDAKARLLVEGWEQILQRQGQVDHA